MRIRRMTATFGKLQNQSLELKDGLNILQAPNETGKSTWCAFLLSMLYGINSRERDRSGTIADKNRYAPWSGSAMAGRLDCHANGQDITLLRSTKRHASPMAEFQALYTGTGETVPALTSANCGEQLLGITREVYARSAFIRQNSLAISQDAELERRIAALISSGEETTSYSEAADTLKKQLNRRRHNKTGQIPALEQELDVLRQQLNDAESLSAQISDVQQKEAFLLAQEASLFQELELHELWAQQQQFRALTEAEDAVRQTTQRAEALQHQLKEDHIPENDTIARLRGAIVNLGTTRRAVTKAREERDEAMKTLLRAEDAVSKSPFAGQTPEQARREASELPKVKANALPAVLAGCAVLAVVALLIYSVFLRNPLAIPAAIPFGVTVTVALSKRTKKKALHATLTKRFGTADPAEIHASVDTYAQLYETRESAQADLDKKTAAADTLYNSLSSNEQAILLEIRRFAPGAFDLSSADNLLRGCAIRRKELAEATTAAREATLRRDILAQGLPDVQTLNEIHPPERDRAVVEASLAQARAELADCRASRQRLSGQLAALGDTAQLQADVSRTEQQLSLLQEEYDSLAMALEALDSANTTLQSRFAPALGQRTAQIFHQLTDGRYAGVVLDRSLRLSAEPVGDPLYRDVGLLSAGTADQLYLAARLAICETVLPEDRQVPIVLDDALTAFDDQRCAAALRYLKELARHRQILLFTCHNREAAFFANDPEVSVQQLTSGADLV